MIKRSLAKLALITISIFIALLFCEGILRVKHSLVPNYDIEMWKYAKQLKEKSSNKNIGHTHVKNKFARLQNVDIYINNFGQRDIEYDKKKINSYERSFLAIGSSVTLGWGVKQENTFISKMNDLAKKDKKNWIFINGGVGNYNTERYVNNYLENWKDLEFTDLIIQFFVNDTEILKDNKTNFFTVHTHIGVVIWKLINSYKSEFKKESLEDYYGSLYNDDFKGYRTALANIKNLNKHCIANSIRCYLVITPDIHQLNPYKLSFINKKITLLAESIEMPYLDLLDAFQKFDAKDLWNKYGDPHPNSLGHNEMSKEIYKFLSE